MLIALWSLLYGRVVMMLFALLVKFNLESAMDFKRRGSGSTPSIEKKIGRAATK